MNHVCVLMERHALSVECRGFLGGGGGELLKLRIDQCIEIQIFTPNCECRALTF